MFHFLFISCLKIGCFIRKWKWKLKKHSNRKSIEGTIYGNIKRREIDLLKIRSVKKY